MNTVIRIAVFSLLCMLYAKNSLAHDAGITDTGIQISPDSLKLTYTVPVTLVNTLQLDTTLPIDIAQTQAILSGISINNREDVCTGLLESRNALDTIGSEQFTFSFVCQQPITQLNIGYRLFFDHDDSHTNIVRVSVLGNHVDETLNTNNRRFSVDVESLVRHLAAVRKSAKLSDPKPLIEEGKAFGTQYFSVGFWHILQGYDHVLFLVCLVLLPMRLLVVLGLITSFTLAHSITLSLSVLHIVTLQPKYVEALIALSVVYVSIRTITILQRSPNNSVSKFQSRERVYSSFLFGLVHGFGFSYLLKEIGMGEQIFMSLLFFNLGVEAGQLLILLFLVPLIVLLGKRFPSWRWAQIVSIFTGLFGLFWLVERVAGF